MNTTRGIQVSVAYADMVFPFIAGVFLVAALVGVILMIAGVRHENK